MIYIYCALYFEAKTLIEKYKLVKEPDENSIPFECFTNTEEGITLVITGVGVIAASVAITSSCMKYKITDKDFIVNIGTCAAKNQDMKGKVYLCNKITDDATGRTFYPDMLYRSNLSEAQLITLRKPLLIEDDSYSYSEYSNNYTLYDMEGAGIWQSAIYFSSTDRIVFIKAVSDIGDTHITQTQMDRTIESNFDEINKVINVCKGIVDREKECHNKLMYDSILFERLVEDLHCSKVMQDGLRQLLTYCQLACINVDDVVNKYYEAGILPCKNKTEGKKYYNEIRSQLI